VFFFRGRCPDFIVIVALLPGVLLAGDIVTVAVASNFATTAAELTTAFSEDTGVPIRISTGSTGRLYAQIVNGAPFDVFLAADVERPMLLETSGRIVAGSRRSYATGRLVLWSRDAKLQGADCLATLQREEYGRLAIANPDTAPYGSSAREVLVSLGLWESASRRAVFGENIAQTLQFVATGNATLGFVAQSQVDTVDLPPVTCSWSVPPASHTPLDQQLVLLKRAEAHSGAQQFIEFLGTAVAKKIISEHGYGIPE